MEAVYEHLSEQVDALAQTLSERTGKEYDVFVDEEFKFAAIYGPYSPNSEDPEQEFSSETVLDLYSIVKHSLCLRIQQALTF
jgi:hypothetical protein